MESVNIPLEELARRVNELPPKEEKLFVVGPSEVALQAVASLAVLGRFGVISSDWAQGESPVQGRLWEPNDFLSRCCQGLAVGQALDLGCGSGRDAVYLASFGWHVTAIDWLPDGIERGRDLANRYLDSEDRKRIEWRVDDLLAPEFLVSEGYELVFNAFFFDRDLLDRSQAWIDPGGSLIIEAFTSTHREKRGKPGSIDRVVKPGEMAELVKDLEIVSLEEGEHRGRHTARLWARKHG